MNLLSRIKIRLGLLSVKKKNRKKPKSEIIMTSDKIICRIQ